MSPLVPHPLRVLSRLESHPRNMTDIRLHSIKILLPRAFDSNTRNKVVKDEVIERVSRSSTRSDRKGIIFETYKDDADRKSTRLNSSHSDLSRMPSSA